MVGPWMIAPLALAPTTMSAGLVLAGLAGLAGIVFALQRLRVRHQTRVVVTTLFWREAVEESRARTLFERFRHPLTYLLLLAIAGLLWLSVGRLATDRTDGVQHTFLLDASANMAVGSRFEDASEALREALDGAPRERTQVLLCGATVRAILAPGDDRALLAARLDSFRPEAAPSSVERALVDALAERRGTGDADPAQRRDPSIAGSSGGRRFAVFGSGPVSGDALAALGESDEFVRIPGGPALADEAAPTAYGNLGIVALGAAPAASGAFDAVDLYIEVQGDEASTARLSVTVGNEPIQLLRLASARADAARWAVRDLRPLARGSSVEARTVVATLVDGQGKGAGDRLAFDDRAELLLPELRLIRVHVEDLGADAAQAALLAACEADAAVEIVPSPEDADVLITTRDVPRPSLRIVPASDAIASIEVGAASVALPASVDSDTEGRGSGSGRFAGDQLRRVLGVLGLDRVDATRLASEIGRPLEARLVDLQPDGARSLTLWSDLLRSDVCSFTESRAFPVVVGRALRWLAEVPEVTPYRAAGRRTPSRLVGVPGAVSIRLGAETGAASLGPDQSLLDATSTRLAMTTSVDGIDVESPGDDSGPWRLSTWVLVLALALLVGEWILFQRGRIA